MKKVKKKEPIKSTKDPRFRSYIMSVLRRASRFWTPSNVCIEKTKLAKGVHQCPLCKKIFKRKEMKKDHIDPVISTKGFTSWDDVIERMFVDETGWQAICIECHNEKTKKENEQRKAIRKEKAVLQYYQRRRKSSDESDN